MAKYFTSMKPGYIKKTFFYRFILGLILISLLFQTSFSQINQTDQRLFVAPVITDSIMKNYFDTNNISIVKLIGQASIDPHNIAQLDSSLLVERIKILFPGSCDSGMCMLDWEGKIEEIIKKSGVSEVAFINAAQELIKAVSILHNLRPNVKCGIYGMPARAYYNRNDEWRSSIEKIAPIMERVDFICPSMYMTYPDEKVSKRANMEYISDNVSLALKLGDKLNKPVLPVVYHRWTNSTAAYNFSLINKQNFLDYVSQILNTVYNDKKVSGIIWWNPDMYLYRTKNKVILKEINSTKSYQQQSDEMIIDYSQEILKNIR